MKTGEKAPDFCLPDHRDIQVCLKCFTGKWVVLYFYPKDNTSGCTIEAIEFTGNLAGISKLNAAVIGISPDSCQSHDGFIKEHKLKVILLSDPEHEVLEEYGAWQQKQLYGRKYWGVVRSTFLINPEGKIAYSWMNVKAKGHAEEVKAKLAELIRAK